MDNTERTMGEIIDDLLKKNNITNKELSKKVTAAGVKLSEATLSDIINDVDKGYSYKIFVEISKQLNVSIDYLLGLSKVSTTNADIKAICNYTGLDEETIEIFNQEKELEQLGNYAFLAFIDYITKDCYSLQSDLDKLSDLTLQYVEYLTYCINDEICIPKNNGDLMDSDEKNLSYGNIINDLRLNINATKYILWQRILNYIDEFSFVYLDGFNQDDLTELEKAYFNKERTKIDNTIQNYYSSIKNNAGVNNDGQ